MEELTPEFTLDRALTKETSISSELLKEGVYKFLKSFLVKKEAIRLFIYLDWLVIFQVRVHPVQLQKVNGSLGLNIIVSILWKKIIFEYLKIIINGKFY